MSRKGERGIALITALLIIVVLLVLMLPLLESTRNNVVLSGQHGTSNEALRAAYAGIEETVYQFELNDAGAAPGVAPPTQSRTYPIDQNGTTASYTVTIDAKRWTSILPYYLLHAVGSTGSSTRAVDALIQKMPFSAFNLFTISEQNNVGGAVVYANGEQFLGPVYSGGPMRIYYQDTMAPIFLDQVTTAQAPQWIPSAPTTGADWNAIITDQNNFHQVSSPLTLPTAADNSAVQNASLVGDPQPVTPPVPPVPAGIYINDTNVVGSPGGALNSGIYISGFFTTVSSTATATTNTFTFNINGVLIEHVIIDFSGNTTTVTDALNTPLATFTGVPSGEQPPGVIGANGAIFSNGQMLFNAGNVFHGKYTFAEPDGKGLPNPNMWMMGSQTYLDPANDELAFWANDIALDDTVNANIEIDGLMLTGYYGECSVICNDGTFKNIFCTAAPTCGGGTGTMTLFGSLVENVRGKRGTLGSSISGFKTDGVFDPRLARTPPPFTPTTTAYNVLALCTEDVGTVCGQ